MYWTRLLETSIAKTSRTFPVTVITGPRQSGKSTLLRRLFPPGTGTYLTLDNPDFRRLLAENPLEFLRSARKPVIIDEFQYLPELASYLKILVDEDRSPGGWLLTGSQQFSVMKNVAESLAGRTAVLSLPPFHIAERKDDPGTGEYVLRGSYPEPVVNREVDREIWYSSYLQTYLERDLRALLSVDNLRDFESFMRILAGLTAQELNLSAISSRLGVSVPTVKRWVSVLEASYIIHLLPPFHVNYGKRVIKSPKVYFLDTGLVCYLTSIKDASFAMNGPMAGALFETAVVSDIIKMEYSRGVKPELYFWRSKSGLEVDVIIPVAGGFVPIEIKSATTIKPAFYRNMLSWIELSGINNARGYLITDCRDEVPLPPGIRNVHWKESGSLDIFNR